MCNIIVFSKNLGQDLSFEGSNIFVGILKVDFLAVQTKKSTFALILRSTDIAQTEEIL